MNLLNIDDRYNSARKAKDPHDKCLWWLRSFSITVVSSPVATTSTGI